MTMTAGPTAPEAPTEGKDLSGGYFILRYSNPSYQHRMRVHFAPITLTGGAMLYVTPPAGLFSDADPTVTASGLMALLAPLYTSDWTIALERTFQMVASEPAEVFPIPTVPNVAGSGAQIATVPYTPEGQITFTTRDDHGHPFRLVALGSCLWGPYPRFTQVDNASGNWAEKLVHYLTQNGAIRSHAGNKALAPMHTCYDMNNRLRREYRRL